MKIAQIRDALRSSTWTRNDYAGHTREEFKRANVGYVLTVKIQELEALVIPPRFVEEIARRTHEVEFCRKVIARWEACQFEPVAEPIPTVVYDTDGNMIYTTFVCPR